MAKQKGIHQLKGKVGGMSYYGQKGVEGGLARSINSGLSNRVKTDEAYANTRLNAAEFGTAGSFAGACIRSISERKRAMMKDFASGDLAKVVRNILQADTTHDWGNRQLVGETWQAGVRSKLNQYAKLPWDTYVGMAVSASLHYEDTVGTVTIAYSVPANWGSLLAAKGADGVNFEFCLSGCGFRPEGVAPFRSQGAAALLAADNIVVGTATEAEKAVTIHEVLTSDGDNFILNCLVVAKPYKVINNQTHILQELCTYSLSYIPVTSN